MKVCFGLRSRRKHKAWGVNPRNLEAMEFEPMKWAAVVGTAFTPHCSVARYRGLENLSCLDTWVTPQALCSRLLRRLKTDFRAKPLCARKLGECYESKLRTNNSCTDSYPFRRVLDSGADRSGDAGHFVSRCGPHPRGTHSPTQ